MKHLQLFEGFSNKEVVYDNIKISYEGNPDNLFLIYYTGYDEFLSHEIISVVESNDDGVKKFEEDAKKNLILCGANVFNYDEVLKMYKPYDQILNHTDDLNTWIEKENKMFIKYSLERHFSD